MAYWGCRGGRSRGHPASREGKRGEAREGRQGGEPETYWLEGGSVERESWELSWKQTRKRREAEEGRRDTHWDTGRDKERKENTKKR